MYITDRAYTESQIREMEMRILDTLGFAEGKVVPAKAGQKELYMALTSDRGLCGAIHSSICKGIRNELLEKPNLDNVAIICMGDKSIGLPPQLSTKSEAKRRCLSPAYAMKYSNRTPPKDLKELVHKVKEEQYLGKTVKDAVITVPAYFNDSQRTCYGLQHSFRQCLGREVLHKIQQCLSFQDRAQMYHASSHTEKDVCDVSKIFRETKVNYAF